MRWLIAVIGVAAYAAAGATEVYRCEDENGYIVLQDRPCDGGLAPEGSRPASPSGREGSGGRPVAGDLDAYLTDHRGPAQVACEYAVEDRALHDFKWTDGWLGGKFSNWYAERDTGYVVVTGDTIKMQTGLGTWVRHSYRCKYDPRTEMMIAVEVARGRL